MCDFSQQRRQQRFSLNVTVVSNAVRLKAVEVREIFAYVRGVFDTSRRRLASSQLRIFLARLVGARLRPVEELASSSALVFHFIDIYAHFHAIGSRYWRQQRNSTA